MLRGMLKIVYWIIGLPSLMILNMEVINYIFEYRLENGLPSATGVALGWGMMLGFFFLIILAVGHDLLFGNDYD